MRNKRVEAWEQIKQIRQNENQDIGDIIEIMNPLFKAVNLDNDESKISFFIASIKPSIAYELAREKGKLSTYQQVIDQAVEIERLQQKYQPNTRVDSPSQGKRVNFEAPIGRNDENFSNPRSASHSQTGSENLSSGLTADTMSELIQAINKLNINFVQRGNGYSNNYHPQPKPERRPLVCWNCNQPGHPSRLCQAPAQPNNSRNTFNSNGNNDREGGMGKGNGHQ